MRVFISLEVFSEKILILRRNERDIVVKVYRSYLTHPLLLSGFNGIWIFSIDFRRILENYNSWKSIQWEPSCVMRTEGRT